MRKIRDVLRYRDITDLSLEAVARALNFSKGALVNYLQLATKADLIWPLPADLYDAALERLLYHQPSARASVFTEPDYARVHQELKRFMRQTHRAGEKLLADYAGPTMPVIDAQTGEISPATIFVAVLGASTTPLPVTLRGRRKRTGSLGSGAPWCLSAGCTNSTAPVLSLLITLAP